MGLSPNARDEQQTLRLAPFWIFSAIAGRDRNFDEHDRAAFAAALTLAGSSASDPLTKSVLEALAKDPDRLWAEYEADPRSVGSGLHDVGRALESVPPEHALAFRGVLVGTIGVSVATARGPYGLAATVEDLQRLRLAAVLMASDGERPAMVAGVA